MAKINATYSSGYYISPDMDYRALEDHKSMERKRERRMAKMESIARRRKLEDREKRKGEGDDSGGDDVEKGEEAFLSGNAIRQTFALPFDIYCGHCNKRMARGSHVYTNRRPTPKKYLGSMRIWSLEIRCRFCHESWYLETDYETPKETGGYVCAKNCRRQEGDFSTINAKNREVREAWEAAELAKIETPLEAMERENELARKLEEQNREVEELIRARAGQRDTEDDLLRSLREGARSLEAREKESNGVLENTESSTRGSSLASSTPVTRTLNHLLRGFGIHSSAPSTVHGASEAAVQEHNNLEDTLRAETNNFGETSEQLQLTEKDAEAEEAAYQQFEAEMMIQQRRERLQQRKAAAEKKPFSSSMENGVDASELESEDQEWGAVMTTEGKRIIEEAEKRYAERHTSALPPLSAHSSIPLSLSRVSPSVMLFGPQKTNPSSRHAISSGMSLNSQNRFLLRVDDDDDDDYSD